VSTTCSRLTAGVADHHQLIAVIDDGAQRRGFGVGLSPNTEVKIADDREILLKGPGVMSAYHDLPDATAEALEQDGWFHTGDIGEIDADGFLRITDRKKDMFKTAQGKYLAPSTIATMFQGMCPYLGEFIVYGDPTAWRWSASTPKRSPPGPIRTASPVHNVTGFRFAG
jgi:long-subunit acyl-CoA synthetase (AMP-forming)